MKKSRFTEEQIIGFLTQAEAGMPIKEMCRNGGFSDATFCKWRAMLGGMPNLRVNIRPVWDLFSVSLKNVSQQAPVRERT
jgi:hypothetical protein